MRERPILFSAPMALALRREVDPKTMTRRIVDASADHRHNLATVRGDVLLDLTMRDHVSIALERCPFGVPGDRLWVKETWAVGACAEGLKPSELHPPFWLKDNGGLWYKADDAAPPKPVTPRGKWRSGRFMPRWASRALLEIKTVRVERLNSISEEDARAEGVTLEPCTHPDCGPGQGRCAADSYRGTFAVLWNRINGKRVPWGVNPWVWVVSFSPVKP